MSVVLMIDSIKCIDFWPGPNPPSNVVYELVVEVDDERRASIEGGVPKGATWPIVDSDALVPFTDQVQLTLKQEVPGIGVYENIGSVVVKAQDLGGRVHQFREGQAHFELAVRVIERD